MNQKIVYLILGIIVLGALGVSVWALQRPATKEVQLDNTIEINQQKVSLNCNTSQECILINQDLGFGCGWAGICDPIDYSLNKYIAVNARSFLDLKEKNCEPLPTYGFAPMCAVQLINDNFIAECISGICEKVPK
ncbi:MAG: hypothetical protein ABIG90_01050 [bacterium]